MGGSNATPVSAPIVQAPFIQTPSIAPQLALIKNQGDFTTSLLNAAQAEQTGALDARQQWLKTLSNIAPQQSFADVWGQSGAYNIAKDTAYLNAENAKAIQKAVDPQGAKIRENTENITAGLTDPAALEAASQTNFAKNVLPGMYGTGLSNKSTVYGSGLFDKGSLQNIQLMQTLAGLGTPYQNLPQVGLNPSAVAQIPGQEQAQAAAQSNAFMQGILNGANNLQSSLEQGANSLYNATAQGYGNLFNNIGQDVQNTMATQLGVNQANAQSQYGAQQANLQSLLRAQQANQAYNAQNTGSLYQGLGTLGGAGVGSFFGPVGTAAGGAAASALGKLF